MPERATRRRRRWIWLRWFGTLLVAILLMRLLLGLVALPWLPPYFEWVGAVMLGTGLVFFLLPLPNEQHWGDMPPPDPDLPGGRSPRG